MNYGTISVKEENGIVWLTLNRPGRLNAINLEMSEELHDISESFSGDMRAIALTGSGNAFCSGADVGEFQNAIQADDDSIIKKMVSNFHDFIFKILDIPLPVIAGVNGVGAGAGFSLALACDQIVMEEEATFVHAYTTLGATPDGASTWILPKLVGLHKAKEIIFQSKSISAREAKELGLVYKVAGEEDFEKIFRKTVEGFKSKPTLALGKAKKLITIGQAKDVKQHLVEEKRRWSDIFPTKDFREGANAFINEREPNFEGK